MAEAKETSIMDRTESATGLQRIVYHMLSPTQACTDGIMSFQLLRQILLTNKPGIKVVSVPFCYGINKMAKVLDDEKVSKDDTVHFVDIIPLPQDKTAMEEHGIQIGYVFDHHAKNEDMFEFLRKRSGTVSYKADICAAKQIFDKFFLHSHSTEITEPAMAALKEIIIPMLDLVENMRDLEVLEDHEARIQVVLPNVDVHGRKDDLCFVLAYILDNRTLTTDKNLAEMVDDIMTAIVQNFATVSVTTTKYTIQNSNAVATVGAVPPPRAETLNTIKEIKKLDKNIRYLFMIRDLGPAKKNISILPTTYGDDAALVVDKVKAYCKEKDYKITGGGRMRAAAVQVVNENLEDIIDFLSKLTRD